MAKAIASHTESAPTDLCTSSIPKVTHKAKDDDSHASTQQPFRFMDLTPELRDIIYTFALQPNTKKIRDTWGRNSEVLVEPDLLAGLSNFSTARALSKVCRTIRHESMKSYYSKKTFVVRGVPDPLRNFRPILSNDYPYPGAPNQGRAPAPDPLELWARTWGVLGAQHIRSLNIRPLGGLVRICMTGEADPVSVVQGTGYSWLRISASEVKVAGVRSFGTSSRNEVAAAWKLSRFFFEIGLALRTASKRLRAGNSRRKSVA